MSERAIPVRDEDRARQRDVLGKLFKDSGMKLTPAAARIGVSASQLSRYLDGKTILPTTTYEAVARAFDTSRDGMAARLLGLPIAEQDDPDYDPSWDFRVELERVYPDDPGAVEQSVRQFVNSTQAEQRVAIRMAEIAQGIAPGSRPEPVDRPDRSAIAG